MDYVIKRIVKGEEACLDRVAPDVFDEPVNKIRLGAYLDDPGHILLAAIANGTIIGQCAAVIHRHPDKPSELYIDEVGVTPAMRRKGVAFHLMKEIFAAGRAAGCESSWLGTSADNLAARGLYEKLGKNAELIAFFEYDL